MPYRASSSLPGHSRGDLAVCNTRSEAPSRVSVSATTGITAANVTMAIISDLSYATIIVNSDNRVIQARDFFPD